MKTKGKFIVIEGIDGSGKTTQVSMLKDRLDNEKFHFTREVSDGPIGKLIRDSYLSGKRKCDERIINMLCAADRLDHITNNEDGINLYLNNGINVICDRYYLSTLAYNSYMMNSREDVIDSIHDSIEMNNYSIELLVPDVTIYINLDPLEALRRINGGRNDVSVYENTTKLVKIHDTYNIAIEILSNTFGDEDIICIDANNLSTSELNDVIYVIICEYIKD